MRPPRPCPSWRRAMSASSASRSSSSPAGMPSTIATSPGPCDSPAVVNRKPPIVVKAIGGRLARLVLALQQDARCSLADRAAPGRFKFHLDLDPGLAEFVQPNERDRPGL